MAGTVMERVAMDDWGIDTSSSGRRGHVEDLFGAAHARTGRARQDLSTNASGPVGPAMPEADAAVNVLVELEPKERADDDNFGRFLTDALFGRAAAYTFDSPTMAPSAVADEGRSTMTHIQVDSTPENALFIKALLFLKSKPAWMFPAIAGAIWLILILLTNAGLIAPTLVEALRNHAFALVGDIRAHPGM